MSAKTPTSRDAKQARDALLKQLAELPLSARARSKAEAVQRKLNKTEPAKLSAKG